MGRVCRTLNIYRARILISFKTYIRYPVNFIMSFVQPMIWLVPFMFMGKVFSSDGNVSGFEAYTGNSDFIGFLVIGSIITSYLMAVFWGVGNSVKEEMRQGVLESNWTAPVSRFTLLISKSLYYFIISTVENIMLLFMCYLVFDYRVTGNVMKALVYMIPGIVALFGIGLMISALVLVVKNANPVIDLTSSIFSGLSGSFFPIKIFTGFWRVIALGLPITYIYDSARALLQNQEPLFDLNIELRILILSAFVFTIIGSMVFKRVDSLCRTKGMISGH